MSDAGLLADGRIAVPQCCGRNARLSTFSPATMSWVHFPEVDTFGTSTQIAIGTDGRLFAAWINLLDDGPPHQELVITAWDPDDGWRMESVLSLFDGYNGALLELQIVALDDGRLYIPEPTNDSAGVLMGATRLLAVDPEAGVVGRTASVDAPHAYMAATTDGRYVYVAAPDQGPVWRYDPGRDEWTQYAPEAPVVWAHHYGAVVDDEGRYWVRADNLTLWVFDPRDGFWRWVNTPVGSTGQVLALSRDQQLYLFGDSGYDWRLTWFD